MTIAREKKDVFAAVADKAAEGDTDRARLLALTAIIKYSDDPFAQEIAKKAINE